MSVAFGSEPHHGFGAASSRYPAIHCNILACSTRASVALLQALSGPSQEAVKAELDSRGHSTETGGVIMATASPAAGTREWEGTYPARPRHVRDARHAVEGFLAG